jgi:hypothetical protein
MTDELNDLAEALVDQPVPPPSERLVKLAEEMVNVLVRAEATDVHAMVSISSDDEQGAGGLLMFNHNANSAMADLITCLRTVAESGGKRVVIGGLPPEVES